MKMLRQDRNMNCGGKHIQVLLRGSCLIHDLKLSAESPTFIEAKSIIDGDRIPPICPECWILRIFPGKGIPYCGVPRRLSGVARRSRSITRGPYFVIVVIFAETSFI